MSQDITSNLLENDVAEISHIGNFRRNNEDFTVQKSLGPSEKPNAWGLLAIVCDGVGGGACGEIASQAAAETFLQSLEDELALHNLPSSHQERIDLLEKAAQDAHAKVLKMMVEDPSQDGMASTLSAAWILENHLYTAQIGDSRVYQLRKGRLTQITEDQSPVAKLKRKGTITEEEARAHPFKNIIDQVIGGSHVELYPDCQMHELVEGDHILLCSDGLSDSLDDASIEYIFKKNVSKSPQHAIDALLNKALNTAGRDNISIIIIRKGPAPNLFKRLLSKISK